jgi:hypothetical protein
VQVDAVGRHDLRVAAAGGAALDAQRPSGSRKATQMDSRVFKSLAKANRRGGLAFTAEVGVVADTRISLPFPDADAVIEGIDVDLGIPVRKDELLFRTPRLAAISVMGRVFVFAAISLLDSMSSSSALRMSLFGSCLISARPPRLRTSGHR